MPVDMTLDRQELDLTYYVGQYRRQLSMARGYHRPINMVNLEDDQMAAAAEYAVAKYLGVFWNALSDNFANLPDLANGDEVKHARNRAHNLLIPGDTKRRDCWYYLVLGEPPDLTIWGKAYGDEVMTDDYWFTGMPRPGWRVVKDDPKMVAA